MRKFLNDLETALLDAKLDCGGIATEADASKMYALRFKGSAELRHAERLEFYPNPKQPHHFFVEEIWIAKDNGYSPWSDNMGGLDLNCDGFTRDESVKFIVKMVKSNWPEWFKV